MEDRPAIQRLLDRPLTDADVREATERTARPVAPPEKRGQSHLLFVLGGVPCALPLTCVRRVALPAKVCAVPHRSNRVVRGLCNLDGDLVLCASLANLLEIESPPGAPCGRNGPDPAAEDRRMIVVGTSEASWAVEVDAVLGITVCDPERCLPPPITVEQARARYTKEILPVDERLVSLLDVNQILAGFEAALT
jgi:chemotaxis-related protein WspD